MLVATAAPATPSSGKGPGPKMKQGPSTMLRMLPNQRTRIAIAASPEPRNTAFSMNSITMVTLPPSIVRVNPEPDRITSDDAPMRPRSDGASGAATRAISAATVTPSSTD